MIKKIIDKNQVTNKEAKDFLWQVLDFIPNKIDSEDVISKEELWNILYKSIEKSDNEHMCNEQIWNNIIKYFSKYYVLYEMNNEIYEDINNIDELELPF